MSAVDALPALSLVSPPGKRAAILEVAAEADRRGFAGIACPSIGGAIGLCASLAHVTNTIPLSSAGEACSKIKVLSVARLLGQAIKSIHEETSVSSLFV